MFARLKRIGIDNYMLMLLGAVLLGLVLPARGIAAEGLGRFTYFAVALLFFLYGAKLDPASVRAGMLNWRLQGLTFVSTYVLIPALAMVVAAIFRPLLGPEVATGVVFLGLLPSTVQSSIAFVSIAQGNVPAAICAASLSNLVGVVLTPLLVALFLQVGDGGVDPSAILRIGTQILLPFVLGQILRPWVGEAVRRHRSATLFVDRGAILLIVYSAFGAGTVSGLWAQIPPTALIVLIVVMLILLALVFGLVSGLGRLCKLPDADRSVLFFCGSTKSLASGLPIATALFPAAIVGATVLPVLVYHMAQLLACAVIAQSGARRAAEQEVPAA
ncbi:bile acid:sodium symporter family protein [Paracoccus sp. C2R09]|nr:bile acid:sodium symporter family protein [Paracoccus sp. C2R09]MBU2958471.1 bile acid:sodium symporter [Paracoccus sp. C2R09]